MKLGYIRVSTKDQNPNRQLEELKKHGVEDRFLFVDKASGRSQDRIEYMLLKRTLRPYDELYVHELDRLGRNKESILKELQYFKQHQIIVRILDVPTTLLDFSSYGNAAKPILEMINNLLIEVFSTLAEHELEKIHKRQQEGILSAKRKGIVFGRPSIPLPSNFSEVYTAWKNNEYTAVMARKKLQLSHSTFYRMVKKYEDSITN